MLWLVILGYRQWRRSPRVMMGFLQDVGFSYAVVVSWTIAVVDFGVKDFMQIIAIIKYIFDDCCVTF
ncbi:unnamed protein product [Brassica napus]|uniref:(rape) hypothetical protein n=1 Tax=Brassica napus TaxID=3708 RepID=A0A817B220_BRANA|nr:unnamed protein product [Brassica napus]